MCIDKRIYTRKWQDLPGIKFPARRKLGLRKGVDSMVIDRIALILAIIGALNWGSIGIFGFDIVAYICGGQLSTVSRVIFTLVGIAGLWCVSLLFRQRDEYRENV